MCEMSLGHNDAAARDFRDIYARYIDQDPDIAAKAKARLRDLGLTVGTTAKRRKTTNH
jgi:plasmid stabilization system protein ParE